MNRLKLVEPTKEYLEQIIDYKREFLDNGDSMDGTSNLQKYDDVVEWLAYVKECKDGKSVNTKYPVIQYLCVRESDNRIVGMTDVRIKSKGAFYSYTGHIGYSIRKSERRKGYATEQLNLALEICRQNSIDKVLITCNRENIASAKTIKACGGIFCNEVYDDRDNSMTQRYYIAI